MIWGFAGAVGCTTIIYIVPPAFYLRVRNPSKAGSCKTICAVCLLLIGFILLIAGMYQAVLNIIHPLHTKEHSDLL